MTRSSYPVGIPTQFPCCSVGFAHRTVATRGLAPRMPFLVVAYESALHSITAHGFELRSVAERGFALRYVAAYNPPWPSPLLVHLKLGLNFGYYYSGGVACFHLTFLMMVSVSML